MTSDEIARFVDPVLAATLFARDSAAFVVDVTAGLVVISCCRAG
jgi:hypothetical protein